MTSQPSLASSVSAVRRIVLLSSMTMTFRPVKLCSMARIPDNGPGSVPAVPATASRRVQQAAGLLLSLSGGRQL